MHTVTACSTVVLDSWIIYYYVSTRAPSQFVCVWHPRRAREPSAARLGLRGRQGCGNACLDAVLLALPSGVLCARWSRVVARTLRLASRGSVGGAAGTWLARGRAATTVRTFLHARWLRRVRGLHELSRVPRGFSCSRGYHIAVGGGAWQRRGVMWCARTGPESVGSYPLVMGLTKKSGAPSVPRTRTTPALRGGGGGG